MVFSNAWAGFTCSASNALATDVTPLTPAACMITLDETPTVVTVVTLPAETRLVRLWTADDSVRVALDAPPLPVGQSTSALVDDNAFTLGDTVLPNEWYALVVPQDSLAHTCQLMSTGVSPRVLLVALVEG